MTYDKIMCIIRKIKKPLQWNLIKQLYLLYRYGTIIYIFSKNK